MDNAAYKASFHILYIYIFSVQLELLPLIWQN